MMQRQVPPYNAIREEAPTTTTVVATTSILTALPASQARVRY
jgi:hypothetical protein